MLSAQVFACAKSCVTHIEKGILTEAQALRVLQELQEQDSTQRWVDKVVASNQMAQETKKAQLQQRNPFIIAQQAMTDWFNYPEFKALIGGMMLIVMAASAANRFLLLDHRPIAFYALLLVASFMLIKIGRSWDKRKDEHVNNETIRLESARQTVCRLAKAHR
jgi:hypothetical protein